MNPSKLRALIAAILALAPLGCSVIPPLSPAGSTTKIILVRHAERDPGADPPLNTEGQARAQTLANTLANTGVTAIYCSDLIRNRSTAQPLADKLGLQLNLISEDKLANPESTAAELINQWITQHAGGTVLWIGNTGSTRFPGVAGINQEIFHQLGGADPAPIKYADLFFVVLPDTGPATILKTTYGGPSSLDP